MRKELIEAIAGLQDETGCIEAEPLVKAAEAEDHPAHAEFEWDNTKAGHQFRLMQARALIRRVRAYNVETRMVKLDVPAYVRDPKRSSREQGYASIYQIKAKTDLAKEALAAEIQAVESRVKRARDLAAIWSLSDECEQSLRFIIGEQQAEEAA